MERDAVLGFGTFEFDPRTGELRKRGMRLKLQAKPTAVLLLLVSNPGKVVTSAKLREELWASDTFVDFEHSLGIAIWKLRNILGDSAKNPRFIETLPRKGYRFIAPLQEHAGPGASATKKMIVVLPFDNVGKSVSEDYFTDGLAEELITQLGCLNPNRLGVIARSSAMRYKSSSKTLSEIASELGVRYLVTGTVRRGGTRLRITAQLVQAADQGAVWAGNYDRLAKDVIGVQIELAEQIAKSLAVELLPQQQEQAARMRSHSPEAHEFYLQGRYQWSKRTRSATSMAIEYFGKAVSVDPHYALAYVGLADCYAMLGFYGVLAPIEAFGNAKQYASKALEIDDSLAEAHSSLAFCLLQFDWNWMAAEHEHLEAIRLNPNCAPAHHWYGLTLTQVGRFPEALRSLGRALDLDPFNVAIQAHVGRLSYFCRDFDRALVELRRAVELDQSYLPGRYFQAMAMAQCGKDKSAIAQLEDTARESQEHIALSGLAYAYGKAGKRAAATRTIEQLQVMATKTRVPPYFLAFAEAGLGCHEEVLAYLEQAYTERFGWLFYLKMEPAFDSLRDNPRFNDLVQRVPPTRRAASQSGNQG